ncbi:uncharacterized protein LOC143222951 [Tachypleus tridentatus]|uniref:uncharacterized protein LOC143222951 n=1 Tax=Tachypleus tridentatus TaxID=6853 RepID=UPI003FD24638
MVIMAAVVSLKVLKNDVEKICIEEFAFHSSSTLKCSREKLKSLSGAITTVQRRANEDLTSLINQEKTSNEVSDEQYHSLKREDKEFEEEGEDDDEDSHDSKKLKTS